MVRFPALFSLPGVPFVVLLCLAGLPARSAQAQASYSADRPDDLSAFIAGSRIYTDYGVDDYGLTVGGDFSRHFRPFAAGLEARYTRSNNNPTRENSFEGGVRISKNFRRLTPYADFLLGYGVIHFVTGIPGYTHDNSVIYNPGAGLNLSVTRQFDLKFDAQQQYWNLGQTAGKLEPYIFSVGVTYHVPFGSRRHL